MREKKKFRASRQNLSKLLLHHFFNFSLTIKRRQQPRLFVEQTFFWFDSLPVRERAGVANTRGTLTLRFLILLTLLLNAANEDQIKIFFRRLNQNESALLIVFILF